MLDLDNKGNSAENDVLRPMCMSTFPPEWRIGRFLGLLRAPWVRVKGEVIEFPIRPLAATFTLLPI
jgi:hypothetical protein